MVYIDESTDSDLHSSFVEIVNEIFGRGQDKGWELDKLKTRVSTYYFFSFLIIGRMAYINYIFSTIKMYLATMCPIQTMVHYNY